MRARPRQGAGGRPRLISPSGNSGPRSSWTPATSSARFKRANWSAAEPSTKALCTASSTASQDVGPQMSGICTTSLMPNECPEGSSSADAWSGCSHAATTGRCVRGLPSKAGYANALRQPCTARCEQRGSGRGAGAGLLLGDVFQKRPARVRKVSVFRARTPAPCRSTVLWLSARPEPGGRTNSARSSSTPSVMLLAAGRSLSSNGAGSRTSGSEAAAGSNGSSVALTSVWCVPHCTATQRRLPKGPRTQRRGQTWVQGREWPTKLVPAATPPSPSAAAATAAGTGVTPPPVALRGTAPKPAPRAMEDFTSLKPKPNWPYAPKPQRYSSPSLVTQAVWLKPAATCTTLTRERASTGLGVAVPRTLAPKPS
mmetsp:Transcript_30829/g.98293  ORF Transcript_30829/g.98293 Transcript_30829/m.98293 type:complete len:370 (+) Transcript_30829:791-1900(+)